MKTDQLQAAHATGVHPNMLGWSSATDPMDRRRPLTASGTSKRDAGGSVCGLHLHRV